MSAFNMIKSRAIACPDSIAHRCGDAVLTYRQLDRRSQLLAEAVYRLLGRDRRPVVVRGHKQNEMLIAFLACWTSGHAYIPVDIGVPEGRATTIIEESETPLVIDLCDVPLEASVPLWTADDLREIFAGDHDIMMSKGHIEQLPTDIAIREEEVAYIIYTSGSTGKPKGVMISLASIGHFVDWALGLRGKEEGRTPQPGQQEVYLNQAPFSFDLSVFDLYMSLASGGTLYSITKKNQASLGALYESFAQSGVTCWVSTPSFAALCLSDSGFNEALLPAVHTFLFCGETLPAETAAALRERFPHAAVINTYGPTESTVAVTDVEVTADILARYPILPIGRPKPGTGIFIVDDQGRVLPEGESGEILITGNTLSEGYYLRDDLTSKAFRTEALPGPTRAYHTGDAGYMKDGYLFYNGRIDFQVKLHGYRIELEEIENHLRALEQVHHAVVVPSYEEDGTTVNRLTALLQLSNTADLPTSALKRTVALKGLLKESLPEYMIPQKFSYTDVMPLTGNGKVDRRRAAELIGH